MLKTLKIFLATFIFAASALAFQGVMGGSVYAQANKDKAGDDKAKATDADSVDIENNLCKGADLKFNSDKDCASTKESTTGLNNLIRNIVNIFSVIVGIIAVIMIIYGGFRYITSGGDSGNVGNAKNTILYAIVGLVIVALAQFIVRFVLNQSTNLKT